MKHGKVILRVALLAFVAAAIGYMVLRERPSSSATPSATSSTTSLAKPSAAPLQPAGDEGFVAYYFHGTRRCRTCRTIQAQAEEAIQARFADELRDGRLKWSEVNLEDVGNEHYAADFSVTGSTLVVAEVKGGRPARFAKLDKVWDLVYQKPAFLDYVAAEVTGFMKAQR